MLMLVGDAVMGRRGERVCRDEAGRDGGFMYDECLFVHPPTITLWPVGLKGNIAGPARCPGLSRWPEAGSIRWAGDFEAL